MSSTSAPVVEHGMLTLGRQLGQGGQGTVHQVTNKKINKAVGGGWGVAYKEYSPAVLPELDAAALAAQVDLPRTLSAEEGRWLCDKTAWPAAVVQRNGRTCGLLMRLVPDQFQFTFRSLAGTSGGTRRLANLEYLLNTDTYVAGIGLNISERDRVMLLADLAATLKRLHRIGITVGDLSPKNLLFTTDPEPECFLIDCDAMRLQGITTLPQAETPDWQIPAGEEKATRSSDVYKFALLAIRLFAHDQTATDSATLTTLSPKLADLARASLSQDPARRPTPTAWAEQLTAIVPVASAAPAATQRRRGGSPVASSASNSSVTPPPGNAAPGGGQPRQMSGGQIAALIAGLIAVVLVLGNVSSGSDSSSTADAYTPSQTEAFDADMRTYEPYEPPGGDSDASGVTAGEEETETPSATPDPVGDAEIGSCFYDVGTRTEVDLVATDCTTGAFEVVDIRYGTTDLGRCADVTDSDRSVSSFRHDLVLCLSYLNPGGDAYHAEQGDCVYGPNGPGIWRTVPCETGNFTVLAVYGGDDASNCDGWPRYNLWKPFLGPNNADLDRVLCLSMNYPDDMGYAEVRQCLLKRGSGDTATFTNTGSCSTSNVVVTGRTSDYGATAFCRGDGWSTWRSSEYPELAYTVCYRWR
ncbi:lipopolysaccharide kinase InaA family protein [Nocardiopsis sp. FIRDI 009]|uniref:lipopolysaccharide kinase InaA family protein n=1 Tax=Nocardiopsis sp. FIRDI 009 TaxID=714197 RepID=UPI001300AE45|nr:lipopolysaccharide kinase InaA family protein [Nocardiopsis sp. FIRDI 009]